MFKAMSRVGKVQKDVLMSLHLESVTFKLPDNLTDNATV